MSDGIGSYYSPSPLRPVGPPEAAPLRHTSGVGSYYNPVPLRPVGPPEASPLHPTNGLGVSIEAAEPETSRVATVGLLFAIAFGFWMLRGRKK